MRRDRFHALRVVKEGEVKMMDSMFRGQILKFSSKPIRHAWVCADLFTKSRRMLVLVFGCFSFMSQRRCLVKGTRLSAVISSPGAMKETRGFTGVNFSKV